MYRNSSASATKRRSANYRWWRAVHLITGFLVALWLLAMSATGVLINHQESLGLTEMDVSNRHLPAHYSDEFHPQTTRLNVILADLHSGRFFGARGNLISDAVALMVFLSIGTGVYSFFLRRSASATQAVENGYAAEERRKPGGAARGSHPHQAGVGGDRQNGGAHSFRKYGAAKKSRGPS